MTNFDLVLRLFLQLTVILTVCRAVAWIGARYLGQTQVVSEMVAGVLLGPSLFGLLAPSAQQWLFPTKAVIEVAGHTATIPHPSMSILYAISQIGLILYMFLVGHEFNVKHIEGRVRHAGLISMAGILVPMIAGGVLAVTVYDRDEFFTPGMSRHSAALYLGASM